MLISYCSDYCSLIDSLLNTEYSLGIIIKIDKCWSDQDNIIWWLRSSFSRTLCRKIYILKLNFTVSFRQYKWFCIVDKYDMIDRKHSFSFKITCIKLANYSFVLNWGIFSSCVKTFTSSLRNTVHQLLLCRMTIWAALSN